MADEFDPKEFESFKAPAADAAPSFDPKEFEAFGGPGWLDTAKDIGKGAIRGLGQAAEHFPGAAASILGKIGEGVGSLGIGNQEEERKRQQFRAENPVPMLTGDLPKPETTPGKFAESIGSFVPAAVASPGSWTARLASALFGGSGAEGAAQLVSDPGMEPYARIIGGIAGGMAPAVGARLVTPLPASQRHLAHVQALEQEGVTGLTAGQRTGYQPLQYAEEHLGRAPLAGRAAEQSFDLPREQFTRAALARVGENAERATPEVMNRSFTRIGNNFDRLARRNNADLDMQYANELTAAQRNYDFLFVDPLRKPLVENVIQHAANKQLMSNVMTGPEYQALRSRIERMRRGQRSDPEMSGFLAEVRDSMDNLMERAIARNNPADLGAWRETRNQYRNMLALERATTGAETSGIVTPAKLKQAAVGQSRRAYARGQGDFAELARAGENVMRSLPQSGTAPRALTQAGVSKLLTTGAAGRALMSAPVQRYLGNQALTGQTAGLPGLRGAALRSLISEEGRGYSRGGSVALRALLAKQR